MPKNGPFVAKNGPCQLPRHTQVPGTLGSTHAKPLLTLPPPPHKREAGSHGKVIAMRGSPRARACVALALLIGACSAPTEAPDRVDIALELQTRVGAGPNEVPNEEALPPEVELENDITSSEAVATALWRNPAFLATLAQLDVARAEVLNAGLFQDPSFWFLFPLGPKQYEWQLRLPIEELWLRPKRVAAAVDDAERVANDLVRTGLDLVRDVQLDLADLKLAEDQLELAAEEAHLREQRARLIGIQEDSGEVDARARVAAESLAGQSRRGARQLVLGAEAARLRLAGRMGLECAPLGTLSLSSTELLCHEHKVEDLVQQAEAARPELRAAELALEASAERAGLSRREGWRLTAMLDANQLSGGGMELGPGVNVSIPIFSRQGATARADAQLELAARRYVETRWRIVQEVKASEVEWRSAREAFEDQRLHELQPLERNAALAERAHQAGELSRVEVLDAHLQLIAARQVSVQLKARLRRALASLQRSLGERLTHPGPQPVES